MTATITQLDRFRADYASHRAREGRAHRGDELRSLPYLAAGPLAKQWAVRARSFEAFVEQVVAPLERDGPLDVLDLGAGNGWLSYRLALRGHRCIAVDIRYDAIDGLGAAEELQRLRRFETVVASFDALPMPAASADIAVFNASLHYAVDLAETLEEAVRCVRSGGCIAVLDTPFYRRAADGEAMMREKQAAGGLAELDCIEFLTRERLTEASNLEWTRHRVRYPLWYELRPLLALLNGSRRPSRFDVWTARVP
jgi:SAM-dependent methyltransferase